MKKTKCSKALAVVETSSLPSSDVVEIVNENPNPARRTVPVALRRKLGPLNPLFDLPGKLQMELFKWMRDALRTKVILQMLQERGVSGISPLQLNDFYQNEAQERCELRQLRGAQEARALMNIVEKHKVAYSPATLAALEQEIFRQVSSGETEPGSIAKMGALFLKVRGNLRADEMHQLRSEKLRRELQGQIDHALERLAAEVDKHPGTRGAFDALRLELANSLVNAEEGP
jgi:hypothetical protein